MIKDYVRSYQGFPKDGIDFKCTASLCQSPEGFAEANNFVYSKLLKYCPVDKIVGLDARGFIFASVFAHRTRGPLVLARKKGKLPPPTESKEYQLEYSTATLEIKSDAISKDDKVIIIDDLMATGGTMNAAIDIVEALGGKVIACACIMDLTYLPGSSIIKNRNIPFYSGVEYS
tara:strand:+ start:186 stop:707 length:522 start_codon:yes stop_codon:yes gene_type:complete